MVAACERSCSLKASEASDEGFLFSVSLVLGSKGEWDRSEPGVGNEVLVRPCPKSATMG